MIAQDFYRDNNIESFYHNGTLPHYPFRHPVTVLDSRLRDLEGGETLLNISEGIFGKGNQHMWTHLVDCNEVKHVDDWVSAESLVIPKIIVVPRLDNRRNF